MIKCLRIDDNLLHGAIAFSWVRNLKLHMIVVADDEASQDLFIKMTLGLSKPKGIRLKILALEEAIEFMKKNSNNEINIMVIVNSCSNAFKIVKEIPQIKSINIGLLRSLEQPIIKYESMLLDKKSYDCCRKIDEMGIELEYRLNYSDTKVSINKIIKNKKTNIKDVDRK